MKPGSYSGNKSPMVAKKQADRKPEKNAVLQEYRQYIDALQIGGGRDSSPEVENIPRIYSSSFLRNL